VFDLVDGGVEDFELGGELAILAGTGGIVLFGGEVEGRWVDSGDHGR